MGVEDPEDAAKAKREQHVVIFLPFLRLKAACAVAGVEFVPLRDADDRVADILKTAEKPIDKILSGYIDRNGEPLRNCVVATIPGRGWDLDSADFPTVTWATSLLFLASWSCNDYYPRFDGRYVNSSNFRIVGQAYSGSIPAYIAVSARRRDGNTTDGGYRHGEFKFSLPLRSRCENRPQSIRNSLLRLMPRTPGIRRSSKGCGPRFHSWNWRTPMMNS